MNTIVTEKLIYEYLNNNRNGLLPYQSRGIKFPEPKEGIVYKMLKQRANNMVKVLFSKENKQLCETIERYTDGLVFAMQMEEIIPILSAVKAPKKDVKGNPHVDVITHHMPLLEAMQTASRKAFMKAFA